MNRVYIIAEIGVNHNGSIDTAKKLVDEAVEAGVDAVKFQTFKTEKLISTKNTQKAPYQSREESETQFEMLKKLELSYENFAELKEYCNKKNVDILSTPYDEESVALLEKLQFDQYKVASADLVNKPLIDSIIQTKKPIIFSTGMATLGEIERTVNYVKGKTDVPFSLLHCTTSYPTDHNDVNMRFMQLLRDNFKVEVGYSDHTIGIEIPLMAVSLGAKLIEKHFTLDRKMPGPDHFASVEPEELKQIVNGIRNIEKAFGDGTKIITEEEKTNKKHMRRSIHLNKDLSKGSKLKITDLKFSRPYEGIELWKYEKVINKELLKDKKEGDPLTKGDILWD
jgi:N-acetylneuraminate synthase